MARFVNVGTEKENLTSQLYVDLDKVEMYEYFPKTENERQRLFLTLVSGFELRLHGELADKIHSYIAPYQGVSELE
ncbi:hypothetical protein [Pontibacter sp. SGAir0037]|uniref:hypothetical protein n=1 Tax=Pontibacter sp. SGAir0037 TaxID=2571030 RepID=UPI0010CD079F|nr:hypothetical protein [Pontibacter sp. SGAir0037]QCR23078.1 hypothetical protein C1N53_12470 [Pontibacter sp. SGAir0037]